MAATSLLTADFKIDRRAVMQMAIAKARRERVAYIRQGLGDSWAYALSVGLRYAWSEAKFQRGQIEWKAECAAEEARLAAASEHEREIARVERALCYAEHADTFTMSGNALIAKLSDELAHLRQAA